MCQKCVEKNLSQLYTSDDLLRLRTSLGSALTINLQAQATLFFELIYNIYRQNGPRADRYKWSFFPPEMAENILS